MAKTQMTINKSTLLAYFKLCSTVLSKREKDDLLYKGVRVTSTDQDLGFLANGNFNAISCWLSNEEMDSAISNREEFDAIIEGAKTLDILTKSTVSDVSLSFGSKDGLVELKANGKNQLRYLSSENFVDLPEINEDSSVSINLKRFYSFIKLAVPFSSEDIHKASLVGICIGDGVIYASDEAKALTLRNTEILVNPPVSISSELLDILNTVLSMEDVSENWIVQLSKDGSYLVLTTNPSDEEAITSPTIRIYIHRYNVDYPIKILERANRLAEKNPNSFTFTIKEMLAVLDRLSIFKDENDLLFLEPSEDGTELRVIVKNLKTSEKGEEFIALIADSNIQQRKIVPLSFTAFFNMLKSFDTYLEEIQLRYGTNFISFHDEFYEAWIVETIVDFKDEEI